MFISGAVESCCNRFKQEDDGVRASLWLVDGREAVGKKAAVMVHGKITMVWMRVVALEL